MYSAGCSRPATDLSRCLPNLKQRSNRQAYYWCSSKNSFVQVWKQAKSRRASDRLLPVLLYIQLGQNHVHSHGKHADTNVRQDMARTVHQAWGSLWWWKCHEIRIWFLRVFTYQESVWLRGVSIKAECVIGRNILGIFYFSLFLCKSYRQVLKMAPSFPFAPSCLGILSIFVFFFCILQGHPRRIFFAKYLKYHFLLS